LRRRLLRSERQAGVDAHGLRRIRQGPDQPTGGKTRQIRLWRQGVGHDRDARFAKGKLANLGVGTKPELVSLGVQEPTDPELVFVQRYRIR
jgi:hypothetical protein